MVALSSSTVAKGGMSMVAWALWALVLVQSLAHASSRPSEKYGDVSGDEVVIDQLEDFLRSHTRHLVQPDPRLQPAAPQPVPYKHLVPNINEKIRFGVGPRDPRFYLPSNRPDAAAPAPAPAQDRFQDFPQDLALLNSRLPHHLQRPAYREEVLQYPEDVDDQYPNQYQQVGEDRYPSVQYQDYTNLGIPVAALDRLQAMREMAAVPDDPRRLGMEELEAEEEEQGEERGREEDKREMVMEAARAAGDGGGGGESPREGGKEEKDKKAGEKATSQPEEVNYLNRSPNHVQQGGPVYQHHKGSRQESLDGVYFVAIVAGCTAVAVFGVISAGICWYRLNKNHRAAQVADYPAYGVTGPNKDLSPTSGDRKLAQSAHMYHYQHQKQQMIALEKSSGGERHGSTSDVDSEEEGEENEYTVYECPGLAPTGEMEVKNPLFHDDPTPATPSMRKEADDEEEEEEEQKGK
ncbi:protein cab-1-like isoform X2 [Penaeus japonicus]|uniref:protein cab-1-like isoform X2 n=1 Tax=Penaeus japonicus TaxID=27405 RepID=UPI001C70C366|nr:protein cab-1-like isoform X2 [Penaeus japonicus]